MDDDRRQRGGDIVQLKLLKHAKNHMETKLSGAVFQLFDENGNALKYDRGEKNGQDITFTTGADGYADISLSVGEYSKGLNFNTKYILREIQAPDGYQVLPGTSRLRSRRTEAPTRRSTCT